MDLSFLFAWNDDFWSKQIPHTVDFLSRSGDEFSWFRTGMIVQVYNTVTIQCACTQCPAPHSDSHDVVRDTFISLRALRCVTFLSPERYNPAVHNISGCVYTYQGRRWVVKFGRARI